MPFKIRQNPAAAIGPAPCAACQAVGRALETTAAELSVVTVDKKKRAWIGIELADGAKRPVAQEVFRVELPDGTTVEGRLDGRGKIRLEGIPPGKCDISFPERDAESWKLVRRHFTAPAWRGAPR